MLQLMVNVLVNRHTGGLEKIEAGDKDKMSVNRHTGGLEK